MYADQVYFKFWMPRPFHPQYEKNHNSSNYRARDLSFGTNDTWMNMNASWKFYQYRIINTKDIRNYLIF